MQKKKCLYVRKSISGLGIETENNRNYGKTVGNNYYLYKHSSKRVRGKNPVSVDTYIVRITPEWIEKSGLKQVVVNEQRLL